MMAKDRLEPFLSEKEIHSTVQELGKRISADYPKDATVLIVVTLKGAMLFAADLVRELSMPILIDFVRVASYGSSKTSSGTVQLTKDLETPPRGRHVLILDEIVDTGRSLAFLHKHFENSGALSVKSCALLSKPSRREVQVHVDYIGREVEDKFLVGYGLDFNEAYRALPAIYAVVS